MTQPLISRQLLAKFFGSDPRMMRAMEDQSVAAASGLEAVAATNALADATVIVLSPNGDFTNERVLQVGDGIQIAITDDAVILSVENVARTQDFGVTLIPPAEVSLLLPAEGTLVSQEAAAVLYQKVLDAPSLQTIGNYANDAAAAVGGVPVKGVYRNGSVLMVRVS